MKMRTAFCVALLSLGLGPARLAQAQYNFTTIDFPGAIGTAPGGINASGRIVGLYLDASRNVHGFFLDRDLVSFTRIDFPGSTLTEARGINGSGQVVGWYVDAIGNHGFFLDSDGMRFSTVDFPGSDTKVFGINDPGDIVGRYLDANGNRHGFLRDRDGNFSAIDFPDPGLTQCRAAGINNRDSGRQIVGWCEDGAGIPHGFLDTGGSFSRIDFPGAVATATGAINNNGDIIGLYVDIDGNEFGFLLDRGGSFTTIPLPGAVPGGSGGGINDSGQIVASYCLDLSCVDTGVGAHGFLATPTTP